MTTIAYRDGVLASDSRATWDDYTKSDCIKMWKLVSKVEPVKGPVLFGGAGDLYAALLFKDWLERGGEPNLHDRGVESDGDFDALIVHATGIYGANRYCRLERITEPYWAHGSGRQAALAAMHCGKSAMDAVRMAARIDPFTGGRVVSMRLDEPEAKPRRKRGSRA